MFVFKSVILVGDLVNFNTVRDPVSMILVGVLLNFNTVWDPASFPKLEPKLQRSCNLNQRS